MSKMEKELLGLNSRLDALVELVDHIYDWADRQHGHKRNADEIELFRKAKGDLVSHSVTISSGNSLSHARSGRFC